MNYIELQDKAIKQYKVNIVTDTKCWRRTHAHVDGTRRICKWKQVNSFNSTMTLLHEIGHIETDVNKMLRCEAETMATKFAIVYLRQHNIPIKQKVVKQYKEYVYMCYDRAVRRGLKRKLKYKLL